MGIVSGLINEKNVLEMSLGNNLLWRLNTAEELNFVYPFNQKSTKNIDLTNAITNSSYSFIVDDDLQQLKTNSNYNVNNGLCFSYIKITIPEGKTATISANINVSSEYSYDIGVLYYTNTPPTSYPNASNCKASTFNYGIRIWYSSSSTTSLNKTLTLKIDGTYYLIYGYAKDSSVNNNLDRFFITNINIKIE